MKAGRRISIKDYRRNTGQRHPNLNKVGPSRCDDPARAAAGGTSDLSRAVAPLNAARPARRAIPTTHLDALALGVR